MLVIGCTLAACGGSDDLSATALEKKLVQSDAGIKDDDPVVKADCPKGLGSDSGAKATCTTTTRDGGISSVAVTRTGDGFDYDSVARAITQARLEHDVGKKHDDTYGAKVKEFASDKVACPGEYSLKPGNKMRCEVTIAFGAIFVYTTAASADGINIEFTTGHWPAAALSSAVLDVFNRNGKLKGAKIACPEDLTFTKDAAEHCSLTPAGAAERTMTVRMTDDEGTFNADY
jgi:hypothetical protein